MPTCVSASRWPKSVLPPPIRVQAAAIEHLAEVVKEELNVKRLVRAENLDGLATYSYKPNLKTLGPKYGKLLGGIGKALATAEAALLAPLRRGENVTLQIAGTDVILLPGDVLVSTEHTPGWVTAAEGSLQIALSTELSPELIREGMARDFVRHVQQLRKDADLKSRTGFASSTNRTIRQSLPR